VRENLSIYAKLHSVPRERRNRLIPELLASVELTEWADKPVKNLSGGMRRPPGARDGRTARRPTPRRIGA